jgi:hypothetical protein
VAESVIWDMQAYICFGKFIERNPAKLFIKLLLIVLLFILTPPPHFSHKTWIYIITVTFKIEIGEVQDTHHVYYIPHDVCESS